MTETDIHYNPMVSPDREDPFTFYRWSRENEPVTFNSDIGAWMVTRYEDIVRVAGDPETFSSSVAAPPLDQLNPPEVLEILAQAGPPGQHMVQADPPEHGPMRAIGHRLLGGQRIRGSEDTMRAIARRLVEEFDGDGGDLVTAFSEPFVHRVLSSLVGIPEADIEQVKRWNDVFLLLMTPLASLEEKVDAARQFVAYEQYLNGLIEERRARPCGDIIGDLVALRDMPGTPVALHDMRMFIRGLYAGGIHTTKDAIDSAVLSMLQDRSRWDAARLDPKSIPAIFEETLRRDAPHRGLTRLVTRDTELAGVRLPAGSMLLLLYGSANRDEKVFDDPDAFIEGRPNIREHLAFGYGIHRCLGTLLARTEGRIALETLTELVPQLDLDPGRELVYSPAFYFRGLENLHVRW